MGVNTDYLMATARAFMCVCVCVFLRARSRSCVCCVCVTATCMRGARVRTLERRRAANAHERPHCCIHDKQYPGVHVFLIHASQSVTSSSRRDEVLCIAERQSPEELQQTTHDEQGPQPDSALRQTDRDLRLSYYYTVL